MTWLDARLDDDPRWVGETVDWTDEPPGDRSDTAVGTVRDVFDDRPGAIDPPPAGDVFAGWSHLLDRADFLVADDVVPIEAAEVDAAGPLPGLLGSDDPVLVLTGAADGSVELGTVGLGTVDRMADAALDDVTGLASSSAAPVARDDDVDAADAAADRTDATAAAADDAGGADDDPEPGGGAGGAAPEAVDVVGATDGADVGADFGASWGEPDDPAGLVLDVDPIGPDDRDDPTEVVDDPTAGELGGGDT